MENASKALIMAGEILLGIMVLSLLVYFFNRAVNFSHTYQSIKDKEEIAQFNSNFTKYMKTDVDYNIRDVVTVINFARNYNSKQNSTDDYIKVCIGDEINDYADITKKEDKDIIDLLAEKSRETKNADGTTTTRILYKVNGQPNYFPAGMISKIKYTEFSETETK